MRGGARTHRSSAPSAPRATPVAPGASSLRARHVGDPSRIAPVKGRHPCHHARTPPAAAPDAARRRRAARGTRPSCSPPPGAPTRPPPTTGPTPAPAGSAASSTPSHLIVTTFNGQTVRRLRPHRRRRPRPRLGQGRPRPRPARHPGPEDPRARLHRRRRRHRVLRRLVRQAARRRRGPGQWTRRAFGTGPRKDLVAGLRALECGTHARTDCAAADRRPVRRPQPVRRLQRHDRPVARPDRPRAGHPTRPVAGLGRVPARPAVPERRLPGEVRRRHLHPVGRRHRLRRAGADDGRHAQGGAAAATAGRWLQGSTSTPTGRFTGNGTRNANTTALAAQAPHRARPRQGRRQGAALPAQPAGGCAAASRPAAARSATTGRTPATRCAPPARPSRRWPGSASPTVSNDGLAPRPADAGLLAEVPPVRSVRSRRRQPARPRAARGRGVGAALAATARTGRTGGRRDTAPCVGVVVDARLAGGPLRTGCANGDPRSRARGADRAGFSYAFVPRQPGPGLPDRRRCRTAPQRQRHLLVLLVPRQGLRPLGLRHRGRRHATTRTRRHRGVGLAGGRQAPAAGHRVRRRSARRPRPADADPGRPPTTPAADRDEVDHATPDRLGDAAGRRDRPDSPRRPSEPRSQPPPATSSTAHRPPARRRLGQPPRPPPQPGAQRRRPVASRRRQPAVGRPGGRRSSLVGGSAAPRVARARRSPAAAPRAPAPARAAPRRLVAVGHRAGDGGQPHHQPAAARR